VYIFSKKNNEGLEAMKKHFFKIGIVVLSGLWTVTLLCAGAEEEVMAVFPMSDKGETCIQVRAGQNFSLKFITSPGTGYGWELAAPLDEKMLTIMGTKNEAPDNGLLGASEYEIWICRALTPGRTEIVLKYVRPWEKDADPLKKHVFKVQIQ
jgi:inhibitor of cysteine peptidase